MALGEWELFSAMPLSIFCAGMLKSMEKEMGSCTHSPAVTINALMEWAELKDQWCIDVFLEVG